MLPIYTDNEGRPYEHQYLWLKFADWVNVGIYPDFSFESFKQFIANEGLTPVCVEEKSADGITEPLFLDKFGQVFKMSTLFSIFEMLVTDGTYPTDSFANFFKYIEAEELVRIR